MSTPLPGFAGQLVAVTGAEGFIGSHLVEALLTQGARVRALVLYNSFSALGWLEELQQHPGLEIVFGDVRDAVQMRKFAEGAQLLFHLAALISVPYSYRAAESFIETNVRGTLNILEAALAAGVRRLVQTSTSEVYGTPHSVPIAETHPLHPQSPYAASKIGADALALSYHAAHKLPLVIARPFNTFGPRQSTRAVIPTIITQFVAGKKELALGELTSTRDFSFVQNTVAGLLAIGLAPEVEGEVINLGSNFEISIEDLARRIGALMGRDFSFLQEQQRKRPEASEVRRLWCDAAKAKALCNWSPAVTFEQGLRQTIAWYSEPANLARFRPGIYLD